MDLNRQICWLLRCVQGYRCGWRSTRFTTIKLRLRRFGRKSQKLWIPLWSPKILNRGVSTKLQRWCYSSYFSLCVFIGQTHSLLLLFFHKNHIKFKFSLSITSRHSFDNGTNTNAYSLVLLNCCKLCYCVLSLI